MTPLPRPSRRARQRGLALIPVLVVVALLVILWAIHEPVLRSAGTFLDNGQQPKSAQAIVVIAGGWRGERIQLAAELRARGLAPLVLVSNAGTIYGHNECELALGYLAKRSLPAEGYECVNAPSDSTRDEADHLIADIRRRGLKHILVVSCDTHMRRAGMLWREKAPELDLSFISAASPEFELKKWYKTRNGRKAVFLEWVKLTTSYFGV